MRYLFILFLICTNSYSENLIYNYETKRIILDSDNLINQTYFKNKILSSTYDVYILGKKNNLNENIPEFELKEEIENNEVKIKKIEKNRKYIYFSKFSKKFISKNKNLIDEIENRMINKSQMFEIEKIKSYKEKEFKFRAYKNFKFYESLSFLKILEFKDWYYKYLENNVTRKTLLIQKLLKSKPYNNPILVIKNLEKSKIREINLRLKMDYIRKNKKKESHELILNSYRSDWFVSNNKIYIPTFNILAKRYEGYQINLDSINFKEIYLHINDEVVSEDLFKNLELSVINLDKIYIDEDNILFTQEISKKYDLVKKVYSYFNKKTNLLKNKESKLEKNNEAKIEKIGIKINGTEKNIFLEKNDAIQDNIKFYVGEHSNIKLNDIIFNNYDLMYRYFGEVYLYFEDKNKIIKNTKIKNFDNTTIIDSKKQSVIIKSFFALVKTLYPIIIILLLVGYPYYLQRFIKINKLNNKSNILIFFVICFGILIITLTSFLSYQIAIFLLILITCSHILLLLKNSFRILSKLICILFFLVFVSYLTGLKLISASFAYLSLILIINLVSQMIMKLKLNENLSN